MKRPVHPALLVLISGALLLGSPVLLAAEGDAGLTNETAAGIVLTRGNTDTSSVELRQSNAYRWTSSLLTFRGALLSNSASGSTLSKLWTLGARYEQILSDVTSAFAGERLEADIFKGFTQKYHSDLGARQVLTKTEWATWSAEAGYRYTIQNELSGQQDRYHYLRAYSELAFPWSWRASALLWVEFLPNLTQTDFWQLNGSASLDAFLTEILSMRLGYLLRYSHTPLPGVLNNTDTSLITSLVLRW